VQRAAALERELAEANAELKKLRGRSVQALERELAEMRTELTATRAELEELRKATAAVVKPAAATKPVPAKAAPPRRSIDVKQTLSMAKMAVEMRKFDRALELCRDLVEHGVESKDLCRGDVYLMMGRIMLEQKKPKQAVELFEQGLTLEPHHKHLLRAIDDLGGKR